MSLSAEGEACPAELPAAARLAAQRSFIKAENLARVAGEMDLFFLSGGAGLCPAADFGRAADFGGALFLTFEGVLAFDVV